MIYLEVYIKHSEICLNFCFQDSHYVLLYALMCDVFTELTMSIMNIIIFSIFSHLLFFCFASFQNFQALKEYQRLKQIVDEIKGVPESDVSNLI